MKALVYFILLISFASSLLAKEVANSLSYDSAVQSFELNKEDNFLNFRREGARSSILITKCNELIIESFWQNVLEKMWQKQKNQTHSPEAKLQFMGYKKALSKNSKDFQFFTKLPQQYKDLQKKSKKACSKA